MTVLRQASARTMLTTWLISTACVGTLAGQVPGAPPSFNFEVRPLLSDRCFNCHGPDERARKAKLRLDQPDAVLKPRSPGESHGLIIPGHPEQSQLWQRVSSDDPDQRMPPPDSNLSLTPAERDLIRRWIEHGAEYQSHWSFLPIAAVPSPNRQNQPAIHPIDAFVHKRLESEGLVPSLPATRETLIRRLTFDLTGLPPTLEEVDDFLSDTAPDAYARLLDRLLASPAYGEQRAREWLDLARYADTYGYQSDVERDVSPWRNWVISAFNQNLPYDQFILWQLAGDLLPQPTREQILATAFNRLHRQTNEGGSIDEEFRTEYAADRVHTFGTVFLGLTLECARCHDHKYDPISQRDYYRLFAFFNNIDESGLYSHFTAATPTPALSLYPDALQLEHQRLRRQIHTIESRLAAPAADQTEYDRFSQWLDSGPHELPPPDSVADFSFETILTNHTPSARGTAPPAALLDQPRLVPGRIGHALEFSGDNSLVCKGTGDFNRTSPFSFTFWIQPTELQERAVILHRTRAWSDSGSRGYELVLEHGRPAFALIHFWPGNAIQVRGRHPLPLRTWTHLAITYDGSSRADGLRIYANGQTVETDVVRDQLTKDILHRKEWGDADVGNIHLTLAGRFRDSGFRNGVLDEFSLYNRCLTPLEVAQLHQGSAAPPPDLARLAEHYLARIDSERSELVSELQDLRQRENDLINDVPDIMVMRELSTRRPTFLLKRGAYDAPAEPVEPGALDAVLPFPDDLPRNRLGLARWVTDRRNPLAARVVVNRVWEVHFGRGLVQTSEDFGSQGRLPSHPQLLDWLAHWFLDQGWDLKALHRLIVTSNTYRQSSFASPELLARDPANSLLACGPRKRLSAEAIRDQALAISGLLDRRIGGPSVRPYQPAGLWEEAGTGKKYEQDHGDKLYRRSLYTFWKRTAPPPNMLTFDAITREVCTARRTTTTTPLQALVLLNDPQFVEAARVLAQRLLRESPGPIRNRLTTAFRLATGSTPSASQLDTLTRLYREQLEHFQQAPDAAAQFIATGESPVDATLPATELAAGSALATALMNLDQFITLR